MDNSQFLEDKRRQLFSNSVFAVKTIFKYAPVVSSVYTITVLVSGLFTPVSIYCLAKLIDGVTMYISGTAAIRQVTLLGVFYVSSLFVVEMFWFIQPKIGRYMNRNLRNTLTPVIIKKYTDIEYHHFEEQHFNDLVKQVGNRPQQYIIYSTYMSIISFIQESIRLIGLLGLFSAANFWIGIGAGLIIIPTTILNSKSAERTKRMSREATTDQRMNEYLQGVFSDKHSAYEIKIFGAKNHFLDLWYENTKILNEWYKKTTKTNLWGSSIVSILKIAYTSFAAFTLVLGFISSNIGLGTLVSIIGAIVFLLGLTDQISAYYSTLVGNAYEAKYLKSPNAQCC